MPLRPLSSTLNPPHFDVTTVRNSTHGTHVYASSQVLILAGVVMAVFQLGVFPQVIKLVGLTTRQRVGFVLSTLAFVAIPAGTSLRWDYAYTPPCTRCSSRPSPSSTAAAAAIYNYRIV